MLYIYIHLYTHNKDMSNHPPNVLYSNQALPRFAHDEKRFSAAVPLGNSGIFAGCSGRGRPMPGSKRVRKIRVHHSMSKNCLSFCVRLLFFSLC